MIKQVFRRKETKYCLTPELYRQLLDIIEPYLVQDKYFKTTNCSVYFDDESYTLAIRSLEKPLYKEKVRIRSYGIPKLDDTVFLENKQKFNGIGNKRRIPIKLRDFYTWYDSSHKKLLAPDHPQISSELAYLFQEHKLRPALYLAYDRLSYTGKDDASFRVTFDRNIRSRQTDLALEKGDHGQKYFKKPFIIMEVKALDAYPLWFTRALSRLKIYPASFSKYGYVLKNNYLAGKTHV